MALDNLDLLDANGDVQSVGTKKIGGVHGHITNFAFGDANTQTLVTDDDPMPVKLDAAALAALETTELGAATISALTAGGGLTNTELRAVAVPVSLASSPLATGAAADGTDISGATMPSGGAGIRGWLSAVFTQLVARLPVLTLVGSALKTDGSAVTQPVSGPLTNTELRASGVPVTGVFFQGTQPVSGPVTDTQLRASAVPVTVANFPSDAALTDTQLRATAVPVSGTVTATGPLTDTQLRAAAVPVSEPDLRNLAQNLSLASTANLVSLTALDGAASCSVQITGTWTGTLVFEGTLNGTVYGLLSAAASGSTNQNMTSTTANGLWRVPCAGLVNIRVRCSVTGTGTAVVSLSATGRTSTPDSGLWRPDQVPRVAMDGTTVFTDTFESLDTTDRWTTGATGSASAPTVTLGNLVVNVLAASTGSSYLVSKPTFPLLATAYENNAMIVQIDAAPISGSHKRWWGLLIPQATPTVALPGNNGVVFETDDSVGTTGALYGAVYSNGVRTQSVTLVRPTDGAMHRYAIYNKTSKVYFEVDNIQVGSIALPSTSVASLPLTIGAVTSGVTGSALVLQSSLIGLSDTGRNNVAINDGVFQWRKATIKPASTLAASTDTSLVVQDLANIDSYITGQGSQLALNNNVLLATAGAGSTDTIGYRTVGLQVNVAAGTVTAGVVSFEGSNDNVNFVAVPLYDVASLTANPVTTYTVVAATSRYFRGPVSFRYFRARISTGLTGTTTGLQAFTRFSADTFYSSQQVVTQATGANLNAAISAGTVTTVTTVTTLANGQTAHSSAATGSPFRIGGKVKTAIDTTLIAGDASDVALSTDQAAIVKPYAVPDLDWSYNATPSGLVNTTAPVTIKGAPAAGTRNYITSLNLSTDALGAATEFAIRDVAVSATSQTIASNILTTSTNHGWAIGDVVIPSASTVTGLTAGTPVYVLTVPSAVTATFSATPGGSTLAISGTGVTATLNHYLLRVKLQTAGIVVPTTIALPSPLKGGTALAQEIVTLTAATGGVYANVQGYVAV